jgi:TonB family protein
MFDVLVESTSRRRGARMWAYFAASSAVWLAVLATTAVAGVMMYDARLDADFADVSLVARLPQSSPPPKAAQEAPRPDAPPRQPDVLMARNTAPTAIEPPRPAPPAGGVPTGGLPNGSDTGATGGLPGSDGSLPPGFPPGEGTNRTSPAIAPPSAPKEPEAQPDVPKKKPIVSKGPISGFAVRRVTPDYPQFAKAAGIEGDVVVEVTVSERGDVITARTLRGPAALREAAERAAHAWKFTPTTLGGTPVKVIGTITFAFKKS